MSDPKVLIASTLAAYKCLDRPLSESQAWLTHAEEWVDARFFAALQIGQGHDEAFGPLRRRLSDIRAESWQFALHDGEESITSGNRISAICTGRNLIHEYMNRHPEFTHLLVLDSDVEPPADAITKLTEVHWPIVAGHIPTYSLDGPRLRYRLDGEGWYTLEGSKHDGPWNTATTRRRFPHDADMREHWASAGCWLLTRDAVNRIRWGWALDDGITDDPWTANLAVLAGLGPMWVRHDCVCLHHPPEIGPVERRGHDLSIRG